MGTHSLGDAISNTVTLTTDGRYLSPFTITAAGDVSTGSGSAGVYSELVAPTLVNFGSVLAGGDGVDFLNGGTVSNLGSTALISGGLDGLVFKTATGVVLNSGTITSTNDQGSGILLDAGGSVTNTGSGIIDGGGWGIFNRTAAATVLNAGTISGAAYQGVYLGAGGLVNNSLAATIYGYQVGILVENATGTVDNSGTITGAHAEGVFLRAGGTVENLGTASNISGLYDGVVIDVGSGTVTNFGSISGGNYQGVYIVGGTVTNSGTAAIITGGDNGIEVGGISGAAAEVGSVVNDGTVIGSLQSGVYLFGGGAVTNSGLSSVIFGAGDGVYASSTATVLNDGTITGKYTTGVFLDGSGNITNSGTASLIFGGDSGAGLHVSGTIINDGTIIGRNFQGVFLQGGVVDNVGAGATISGGHNGVYVYNDAGTVVNAGRVEGGYSGVLLGAGGSITNTGTSSTIYGHNSGAVIYGLPSNVVNDGTITGLHYWGVLLGDGGYVLNSGSGALISGDLTDGVEIKGGAGTVVNQGLIIGSSGAGIYLAAGGTVSNSGAIGGDTAAVIFGGTLSNLLIDDPGARFTGAVAGSSSATNTLELAAGSGAGTLSGFDAQFSDFSSLVVDSSAVWDVAGVTTFGAGIGITNDGTIAETTGDTLSIDGAIGGSGVIDLDPTTVTLDGGVSAGQKINFVSGLNALDLGDPGQFYGTLNGFAAGDIIDLTGLAFSSITSEKFIDGVLTLSESVGSITLTFANPSVFTPGLSVTQDGGGTEISLACFASGTRILTEGGAVAVEDLAVGDKVITQSGEAAPVVWLGHRWLNLAHHPKPESVQPVLIRAGAIADGVPQRDLVVSPDHALYFDGYLIPAKALLNGKEILQLDAASVTYYHVELPEHAVLIAEGAMAESYLDTGNRGAFANADGVIVLHPDFSEMEAQGQAFREQNSCALLVESGPVVEEVRRRLLERAAIDTTGDADFSVRLCADGSAILVSRSGVPGELTPDPRDRRRLGVKVAAIEVGGKVVPIDHPELTQGWHDVEPDGRWTDGRAVIPAEILGGGILSIGLVGTMCYPVESVMNKVAV